MQNLAAQVVPSSLSRRVSLLQLLDTLRAHLFLSRFALTAYGSGLTSLQAYLLEYLDRAPDFNLSRIAALLGVNKSSVSRAANELESGGFVRVVKKGKAARTAHGLELTRIGRALLDAQYALAKQHVDRLLSNLDLQTDKDQLLLFLRKFADGCQAPAHPGAESDPRGPHFVAMRRLSLAHGLGSGNFFGSGYPIADWALLSEVHLVRRDASQLIELFAGSQSSISQTLRRFEREGLLEMERTFEDLRRKEISLTTAGIERWAGIEQRALERMSLALADFNDADLRANCDLFIRYVGPSVRIRAVLLEEDYIVSVARQETQLPELRWRYIEYLVNNRLRETPLGASLFAPQNLNLEIRDQTSLRGAAELKPLSAEVYQLQNFFLEPMKGSALPNATQIAAMQRLLPPQARVQLVTGGF